MRFYGISSGHRGYFHLSYVDSIGIFCAGGQVSNLTGRFDSLFCFLDRAIFLFDRIPIFVEDIISYFTVCTADGNSSVSRYPRSIICIRTGMLFSRSVITSLIQTGIFIIFTCISARYRIFTNSNAAFFITMNDCI